MIEEFTYRKGEDDDKNKSSSRDELRVSRAEYENGHVFREIFSV